MGVGALRGNYMYDIKIYGSRWRDRLKLWKESIKGTCTSFCGCGSQTNMALKETVGKGSFSWVASWWSFSRELCARYARNNNGWAPGSAKWSWFTIITIYEGENWFLVLPWTVGFYFMAAIHNYVKNEKNKKQREMWNDRFINNGKNDPDRPLSLSVVKWREKTKMISKGTDGKITTRTLAW